MPFRVRVPPVWLSKHAFVALMEKEKGKAKKQKALGWKIGAGGTEKAPRKVRGRRAVRERLRVLLTGEQERGFKKEKQEGKKPNDISVWCRAVG